LRLQWSHVNFDRSSAFKRDYKREAKGLHRATLDDELEAVLKALATDQLLDAQMLYVTTWKHSWHMSIHESGGDA
jgi:mRNA interferase YafQ